MALLDDLDLDKILGTKNPVGGLINDPNAATNLNIDALLGGAGGYYDSLYKDYSVPRKLVNVFAGAKAGRQAGIDRYTKNYLTQQDILEKTLGIKQKEFALEKAPYELIQAIYKAKEAPMSARKLQFETDEAENKLYLSSSRVKAYKNKLKKLEESGDTNQINSFMINPDKFLETEAAADYTRQPLPEEWLDDARSIGLDPNKKGEWTQQDWQDLQTVVDAGDANETAQRNMEIRIKNSQFPSVVPLEIQKDKTQKIKEIANRRYNDSLKSKTIESKQQLSQATTKKEITEAINNEPVDIKFYQPSMQERQKGMYKKGENSKFPEGVIFAANGINYTQDEWDNLGEAFKFAVRPQRKDVYKAEELETKTTEDAIKHGEQKQYLFDYIRRSNKAIEEILSKPDFLRDLASVGGRAITNMNLGKYGFTSDVQDIKNVFSLVRNKQFITEIQDMRANNDTGGAVGNVSNFEVEMFMNSAAALQDSGSAGFMYEQLATLHKHGTKAIERNQKQYKRLYGRDYYTNMGLSEYDTSEFMTILPYEDALKAKEKANADVRKNDRDATQNINTKRQQLIDAGIIWLRIIMATEYTSQQAEEEARIIDYLHNNQHLKGTNDPTYETAREYLKEIEGYWATPEGFVKTAIPAAAGEIADVAKSVWKGLQNPTETAKKFAEGVGDVGVTAATNLLPKSLVDSLFSYENEPSSKQYQLNEWLKNNIPFLATKPRQQYEKMGEQIGQDINVLGQKLSSPDTAARLIAENPLESVLNFSGLASLIKAPIRKMGLLEGNIGKKVDVITDQSPTSLISGVPQYLKSKKNIQGDIIAANRSVADKVIKDAINSGYVLPPRAYKGESVAMDIKKLGNASPFIGQRTTGLAIQQNQAVTDKLIRKYLNVPETTALEDVLDVVKDRSGGVYNEIQNLKGKVSKGTKEVTTQKTETIRKRGQGKIEVDRPTTESVPDIKVIYRDGKDILKDLKSQREKTTQLYQKGKFDDAFDSKVLAEKFEQELIALAEFRGKGDLVNKLKDARKDYAKAYSVAPYVEDGNLNAVAFARGNRKNTALTDEALIIKEFGNSPDAKPYLIKPKPDGTDLTSIEKYALAGLAFHDLGTASAILGASRTLPSLLLSKGTQAEFLNPNYGAAGLLSTLGNATAVRNAVIIPSLLQSSGIEDIKYLED